MIAAIVLGAMAGAVVESCKRGLIKSWGDSAQLPPVIKLCVLAILMGIPAYHAGTFVNYLITALTTVGGFTVARWSVASVIVLWPWRR